MSRLGGNPTVDALFNAFTNYGRNNSNWQWNPGIGGWHYGKLIDGISNQCGECALFAANFWMLAWAPKPYGLGISDKDITVWNFTGKHDKGFVSKHNHPTIISPLLANVRRPDLVQSPTDLYLWENHKVVVYQGKVYDPSYGIIYDKPTYLGRYQVKMRMEHGERREDDPPSYKPAAKFYQLSIRLGEDQYVVAGDSETQDFLFRMVPNDERPDLPFQGPYQLVGDEVVGVAVGA